MYLYIYKVCRGVRGRVRVIDLRVSLSLTAVGSNSVRDLDFVMWGSYPASLCNVGGSTQVATCVWNTARRGNWGLPLPVKLEFVI